MKKAAPKVKASAKPLPPWLNKSKMGMGPKKTDNEAAEGELPTKMMAKKMPMKMKKGGKAC